MGLAGEGVIKETRIRLRTARLHHPESTLPYEDNYRSFSIRVKDRRGIRCDASQRSQGNERRSPAFSQEKMEQ